MGDDALRKEIEALLSSGLETHWKDRAETSEEAAEIARTLQDVTASDVRTKLVVAGFLVHPYEPETDTTGLKEACETCMYFEQHALMCVFPELQLPVEAQWSCVLWRV